MSQDHFRDYLNVIGRYPLLTPEQEIQLSRQVHRMLALKGEDRPLTKREEREVKIGKRAKDAIINSNLRLVVHIAKRYKMRLRSNGMEMMDLIQEGAIGLDRAAEKFDGSKGYRFTTYAYWWIRQSIGRAIDVKERLIKMPSNVLQLAHDAARAKQAFIQEHGRWPTMSELAAVLEVTVDELSLVLQRNATHASLDALIADDGLSLVDVIASNEDNKNELADEYHEQLQLAFFSLKPAEQEILRGQYCLYGAKHKTLTKLGSELGVTRERIRQRMVNAQRKLKLLLHS
jgi:RNA polymerase sigma factor (sigma-70 family)